MNAKPEPSGERGTLDHADEIADGMRQRCVSEIQRQGKSVIGVVFSTTDVLYLLDVYDAVRGRHSGRPELCPSCGFDGRQANVWQGGILVKSCSDLWHSTPVSSGEQP